MARIVQIGGFELDEGTPWLERLWGEVEPAELVFENVTYDSDGNVTARVPFDLTDYTVRVESQEIQIDVASTPKTRLKPGTLTLASPIRVVSIAPIAVSVVKPAQAGENIGKVTLPLLNTTQPNPAFDAETLPAQILVCELSRANPEEKHQVRYGIFYRRGREGA